MHHHGDRVAARWGTTPASCSGAVDSNYTITYVSGSVAVSPAPLTVTASSGIMTYGGSPPAITASYSGFVNGQGAVGARTGPDVHDGSHGHQRGGVVRVELQRGD